MLEDQYGCPLSTQNPEVVQQVNLFIGELVCLGKKTDSIREAVEKYPEEVILQLYAAIFYLYGQTFETQRQASQHLDKASQLLEHANEREKSLYTFAWHWCHQSLTQALKDIERHCFKWPKDLAAIKITEFLFYCKGQQYESKRFLRLTSHCYYLHKDNPFFLAIHAFALELNAKYEEALQTAKRAIQLEERNPWAHHTLSHLYLKKGPVREGIETLEHYSHLWPPCHRAIESHNFWHLALLYLENLDFEQVRKTYQRAGWNHPALSVTELVDAIALLWRLDLEQEDEAVQWKLIADAADTHAHFGGIPFVSAHLCYALKKGGKEQALHNALTYLENHVQDQAKEDRFVWKDVGLPLIYGSLAYADKDYKQAVHYLEPIMEKVGCVGGSDAQIDLFYQTYWKSLVGAQRDREAESLLHRMTQGRDLTNLERKWLAECHSSARLV